MKKRIIVFLLSALFFCYPLFSAAASDCSSVCTLVEWEMLNDINEYRTQKGLLPLSAFPELQNAARNRAAELLTLLSHYRPDSKPWYTALTDAGLVYDAYSVESIASNFTSSKSLIAAWSASAENNKNLSSVNIFHAGIGYAKDPNNKNKSAWEYIGISCPGINSVSVCSDSVPHIKAGSNPSQWELTVQLQCPHGDSFLGLCDSMVQNYAPMQIGTQTLTVNYGNLSSKFTVINDFTDTVPGAWYYDAVMNCIEKKYFSGNGSTAFDINGKMTRAMFVTVLGNMAGINKSEYKETSFSDVIKDAWYAPYVQWAYKNGLSNGVGNNCFAPEQAITRQEICVLLYKYSEKFSKDLKPLYAPKTFTDASMIASWAKSAVEYCQTRGIVTGNTSGAIEPTRYAMRCETAMMISNYASKIT